MSDRWKVYPRVGGETLGRSSRMSCNLGLSPRGRGNLDASGVWRMYDRSIPAWAGKPPRCPMRRPCRQVYPRVGGETSSYHRVTSPGPGLSPRGRGNRRTGRGDQRVRRSIPAWAGKPASATSARRPRRVYPRVGGETTDRACSRYHGAGLSPRGRGNPRPRRC